MAPSASAFYAVPYAVAYADDGQGHRLIVEAADAVAPDDAEFAGYLRNRARDLLTNDYESGDASWVTGRLRAAERADRRLRDVRRRAVRREDVLRGQPAAARREGGRWRCARRIGGLQEIENALPYDAAQAGARGHPRRRLRRDRRLRAGARHEHRHHPAQRGVPRAPVRAHDPAARQHHAQPEHLRGVRRRLERGGGRRPSRGPRPPRATSTARCGTRSATTWASIATARGATSTRRCWTTRARSRR